MVSTGSAWYSGVFQDAGINIGAKQNLLNTCFTWANYVEDQHARGVPLEDIDRRGRWFTNVFVEGDGSLEGDSITDVCGTAEGIVQGKGRPPSP